EIVLGAGRIEPDAGGKSRLLQPERVSADGPGGPGARGAGRAHGEYGESGRALLHRVVPSASMRLARCQRHFCQKCITATRANTTAPTSNSVASQAAASMDAIARRSASAASSRAGR